MYLKTGVNYITRSFMICSATKCQSSSHVRGHEIGRSRSHEWDRREIYVKLYYLTLKERNNLEDPGECRRK
jgi:hypothetical protein